MSAACSWPSRTWTTSSRISTATTTFLGRRDTAELRRMIGGSRDRLASELNDSSSTGHVIARRWTTEDRA